MLTILYIKGTSVSNKRSNPETAFKKAICMTAHIINRYGTIFKEEGATKKYVSKYPDYKDYDSLNLEKIPAVFQNKDITVMNDRYGHFWQMIWRSCDANDPKRRPIIIEACFSINKNNTINIMIRHFPKRIRSLFAFSLFNLNIMFAFVIPIATYDVYIR